MSEKRIVFEVECFDRQLIIDVDRNKVETANNILQERYDVWNQYTDEDVQCQCCKEYMLEGLDNKNISYKEIEFVHVLTSEWNGIQNDVTDDNTYGCNKCGKRFDWDEGIVWVSSSFGLCEKCYDIYSEEELEELRKA